jgi:ubiquinone/menaquinone biosynthesis C-methylase UbiE
LAPRRRLAAIGDKPAYYRDFARLVLEEARTQMVQHSSYIPALRFHWLTRLYDPLVAFTTRESVFREAVADLIVRSDSTNILDLGCGTGTLAVMLKQRMPDCRVLGLDADPAVLNQARKKANQARIELEFDEATSFAMPYSDDTFDLVVSCLFFHHLTSDDKIRTLGEVARVLRPGGLLVVCDWGKPTNALNRISFGLVRLLDGFEVTRDNREGRLAAIIRSAGFGGVTVQETISAPLGTLELLTAELA